MSKTFYVGIKDEVGGKVIYVSEKSLGPEAHFLNYEMKIKKHLWRSAAKHFVKYNLYDIFYKAARSRRDDVVGTKKSDENAVKADAKATMNYVMAKDDKDDFKVVRI